jgi:hypothetical protein
VQRTWTKWGVIVALISCALAAIFVTVLFFGITSIMKNSTPYLTAIEDLHANRAAMTELGEPVTTSFPRGSISANDGDGEANLKIPVQGTSKSGVVYVEGELSQGDWHYTRIELVVDGQHVDLNTDAASASSGGK